MTDEAKEDLCEEVVVSGKKVLAARYQYFGGVVQPSQSVAVPSRDPLTVPFQNGAVSFDFVELYWFTTEGGKVFQCLSSDAETYYWGIELTISEVEAMQDYAAVRDATDCERFVLTEWGAMIPLNDNELVIPRPDAFELPPDMRV